MAFGAGGPMRHFIPYTGARAGRPAAVHTMPLPFIVSETGPDDLWERHVGGVTDLSRGLAVIVAANEAYQIRSDHVYLIVQHPAGPQTFKAAVGWRPRSTHDFRIQAPGVFER